MNRVSALVGLGLAVLIGVLWLKWHDAQVRATVLLVQRDSVLEVRRQEIAAVEVGRLATAAEHAKLRLQLEAANQRSAAHDSVLRMTAGRLDSALHAVIPADLKPLLDSLIATYEGRLAGKDSTISRQDLALRDALGDQTACDSAAGKLRGLADDYKDQAAAWRRRAQPGLLRRIAQGLPWAAGGAGAVALVVLVGQATP